MSDKVLPASAGMILADLNVLIARMRAPRICGDDPTLPIKPSTRYKCSPHLRG